jgi:tRNA U34 5-carboxymethylaminomethyl modifying GTPase MnmE/TrmE
VAYILAVDLGTTFTAAATVRDGGPPHVVTLEHHGTSVPSVLWLGADQSMLVGTPAARRAATDSARVAREFKRRIGDTTPILVGGSPYSAEQLSAKLLRWVYDVVCAQEGEPPTGLAITHPANWGPYKLELLNQLIRIAEVGPTVIITEPEAAAIQYAASERLAAGEKLAVYDLGGGTFDVAILEKTADGFRMLGEPEGVERLGGIDFDAAVYGWVIDQLGDALDDVPPDNPDWIAALTKLRDECTLAKETLSVAPDATIEIWLPNGRHQVAVTAEKFNDLIVPPVAETVKAVRRALQAAHVAPADVAKILLVGGSSRIPAIRTTLQEELGITAVADVHAKHAVVLGAARFAATAAFRDEVPASRIAEVAAPIDTEVAHQEDTMRLDRRAAMRSLVQEVAHIAGQHDRTDLVERMSARLERLDHQTVRVLVAGDFKQGKSTLVNALVDHDVCPSDPDFATAVPTSIQHGAAASAIIYRDLQADFPEEQTIDMSMVGRYVSETDGADPDRDQVRSCRITLPVEWLSAGIELVDMPGYGGLDATAGARVYAELRQSHAVLFVSDASQELTAPELDFLKMAMENCGNVTCVMTKIDAYIDWRLIRDLNTRHLQNADLDVPIVAVSALLHLGARRRPRPEYAHESGIDELVRLVSQRIVAEVETEQLVESIIDTETAVSQLRGVLLAEQSALDPATQASTVAELTNTLHNVSELRLDSAAWHRYLRDGTDDLRSSTLDEFDEQLHELTTEAESILSANDPALIWDEFQSWLRARASKLVTDLYGQVGAQVQALEHRLIEQLADAEDDVLAMGGGLSSPFIGSLRLDLLKKDPLGESNTDAALGRSWGAAEPLLGIGGFIPGLGPISLAVAGIAALTFGRKAIKDRKARALESRREQAREHLKDYADDARKLVGKSIERYASHLYRGMRDSVLKRADELERSVTDALRAATAAGVKSDSERQARLAALDVELRRVDELQSALSDLHDDVVKANG